MAAALALLLFLLAFPLVVLLWLSGGRSKTPSNLPAPPSPPKLPLIGNLHQLPMGSPPHRSLRHLSDIHGPLMLLHLFRTPTLVVSSPEIAQQIMTTHDLSFADRPRQRAAERLFYGRRNSLFSPYDDHWRLMRKIFTSEVLSNSKVRSFRLVREEEVGSMVERISQLSPNGSSAAVDLRQLLIELTNRIVSRMAVGRKVVLDTVLEYGALLGAFSVGDFFPRLAWVDVLTGLEGRLKRVSEAMDDFLEEVVQEHEMKGMKGEQRDRAGDFLDVLLQLQSSSELNNGGEIDRATIKAMVLGMFTGGTQTTALTIEWAMAELMKNPQILQRAQEEVRKAIGGGEAARVEEDHLQQMPYLKCLIRETLRLHPIAPLLVPRETTCEVVLQGYAIPRKARVFVNAWAIARDPRHWERPEEFLPDRFAENPSVDPIRGRNFAFIPFGGGRRVCPGVSLSMVTMELALAGLLHSFDWSLAAGEKLDMSEGGGLAVGLRSPLRLLPTRCGLPAAMNG